MKQIRLHQWHQTKQGLLAFALIELLAAYLVGSRALETGSLIEYALAIILFAGAVHNFIKFIGKFFRGSNKAARTR